MPVRSAAVVPEKEHDKYKVAAAAGIPAAFAGSAIQHGVAHQFSRQRPGGYTAPKSFQFKEVFRPGGSLTHLSGKQKAARAGAWLGGEGLKRVGGPLAAAGAVGLATTRARKPQSQGASYKDRTRAAWANVQEERKQKPPELSGKEKAAMTGAALGGTTGGAALDSLVREQWLKKKNPAHLKALQTGKKLPGFNRAVTGAAAGLVTGSLALRGVSNRIAQRHKDYKVTPFGLRQKQHYATPNKPVKKSEASERARRLSETESPSRYPGTPIGQLSARIKHGRSANRHLKSDPEAKLLAEGIHSWSGKKGPEAYRTRQKGTRHSAGLDELRRHVEAAPATTRRLHRGLAMSTEQLAGLKPGTLVDHESSSWSSDPKVARRFSRHRKGQGAGQHRVHMTLEPGAQALHVSPLARRKGLGMSEYVSAPGKHKVSEVKSRKGRTEITMSPVGKKLPLRRIGAGTGLFGAGAGGGVALGHRTIAEPFRPLDPNESRQAAASRIQKIPKGSTARVNTHDLAQFQRPSGFRVKDKERTAGLAHAMGQGVPLQPIRARQVGSDIQIRDGAHRLQAAQMRGAKKVPVYMEHTDKPLMTSRAARHKRLAEKVQARGTRVHSDEEIARLAAKVKRNSLSNRFNQKMSTHQWDNDLAPVRYGKRDTKCNDLSTWLSVDGQAMRNQHPVSKSATVSVVPVTTRERKEEAHRKRVQSRLSTVAGLGTIAGLGAHVGGKTLLRRATSPKLLKTGQKLKEGAQTAAFTSGGVGAASGLYFGQQQRAQAKELAKPAPAAIKAMQPVKPLTAPEKREKAIKRAESLVRTTGIGQEMAEEFAKGFMPRTAFRSLPIGLKNRPTVTRGYIARRRMASGATNTYTVRGRLG